MKVLIIEDSAEAVEAVSLLFELHWPGVTIISTAEGNKGVELVRIESPHLVILDLGLPDIDGLEVLRQIRSFSDIPVVILSARDAEMDKDRGLELGADDYVAKPFSPSDFLARVRIILRRSQMPGLRKGTSLQLRHKGQR